MRMQFENSQRLPSTYDLLYILVATEGNKSYFIGVQILDKTSSITENDFEGATISGYHGFKAVAIDNEEISYGDVIPEIGNIGELKDTEVVKSMVWFQGEPVWQRVKEDGEVRVISKYEGALTRTLMFKGRPDRGLTAYLQKRIEGGVKTKYIDFEFGPKVTGLWLPETLWDEEFQVEGFTPSGEFHDDVAIADAQENITCWLYGCELTGRGQAIDP